MVSVLEIGLSAVVSDLLEVREHLVITRGRSQRDCLLDIGHAIDLAEIHPGIGVVLPLRPLTQRPVLIRRAKRVARGIEEALVKGPALGGRLAKKGVQLLLVGRLEWTGGKQNGN